MQSITLLINRLQSAYPDLLFDARNEFHWSPENETITYPKDTDDTSSLLHEVAHAVLEHASYTRDIELIKMERAAWQYAQTHLAPFYEVTIPDDFVEDSLDTYRDWLHARSLCPQCSATGIQIKTAEYKCVACHAHWQVNEARICALRRYKITTN
ncbi:MAG TPA: hypothetical protein VLG36_01270 [Candidatus Chromulinivoraceae bacterium]|nr:hypothetical protein [Candidatus Chromulinivoraceae bacterium]